MNVRNLPLYRSHKVVRAAKILAITAAGDPLPGGDPHHLPVLTLDGVRPPYAAVTPEWIDKHAPQVGGYFVVYEDGYQSFSPAKAFEEGYTSITAPRPEAERSTCQRCLMVVATHSHAVLRVDMGRGDNTDLVKFWLCDLCADALKKFVTPARVTPSTTDGETL